MTSMHIESSGISSLSSHGTHISLAMFDKICWEPFEETHWKHVKYFKINFVTQDVVISHLKSQAVCCHSFPCVRTSMHVSKETVSNPRERNSHFIHVQNMLHRLFLNGFLLGEGNLASPKTTSSKTMLHILCTRKRFRMHTKVILSNTQRRLQ